MPMEDGSHPCTHPGCESVVAYDDEPFCFVHSPDCGSFVRGYSYKEGQTKTIEVGSDTLEF